MGFLSCPPVNNSSSSQVRFSMLLTTHYMVFWAYKRIKTVATCPHIEVGQYCMSDCFNEA